MDRIELYKAVKYEVDNFKCDHGFTLPELWSVVTGQVPGVDGHFWRMICLDDYRNRRAW